MSRSSLALSFAVALGPAASAVAQPAVLATTPASALHPLTLTR